MRYSLVLLFFTCFSHAEFSGHKNANTFIIVHGQFVPGAKGLDRIESPQRTVVVDHKTLLEHNPTDSKRLLKRKAFKLKVSDIKDVYDKEGRK